MTPISAAFSIARWAKHTSIATCIAIVVTAHANPPSLVLNGSFEDPSLPVGGFVTGTGGTDWSSSHAAAFGPGIWDNGYLSFLHQPAIDGHQVLWLPPGASVWQTVSLQAGTFYDVSFYASAGNFTQVLPMITLTLTDSTNFTPINVGWGTPANSSALYSIGFTATTTDNYVLRFTSEDTLAEERGFGNVFVDDISMYARPASHVPDGAPTGLLAALGMTMLVTFRRRAVPQSS